MTEKKIFISFSVLMTMFILGLFQQKNNLLSGENKLNLMYQKSEHH